MNRFTFKGLWSHRNTYQIEGIRSDGFVSRDVTLAKAYIEPIMASILDEIPHVTEESCLFIYQEEGTGKVSVYVFEEDPENGGFVKDENAIVKQKYEVSSSREAFLGLVRDLGQMDWLHEFEPKFKKAQDILIFDLTTGKPQAPYPFKVKHVMRMDDEYRYTVEGLGLPAGGVTVTEAYLQAYPLHFSQLYDT